MAMGLLDEIVASEALMQRLAIPPAFRDWIADSWRRREPHLYGRLDLAYDGRGPAKLYELNYDTPTSLFESAFFQWQWLEDQRAQGRLPDEADQFNSIHEALLERFAALAGGLPPPLYFAAVRDSEEDQGTIAYLRDCAMQAGVSGELIAIEDIGLSSDGRYTDLDDTVIGALFKLYPLEDMFAERFGQALPGSGLRLLEPPWKALLSNKGILPLLWERHRGHPNLLPAAFDDGSALPPGWVRKPLHSREGANIVLHLDDGRVPGERRALCRAVCPPAGASAAGVRGPLPDGGQLDRRRPRLRHRHPRGRWPDHPRQRAVPAARHRRGRAAWRAVCLSRSRAPKRRRLVCRVGTATTARPWPPMRTKWRCAAIAAARRAGCWRSGSRIAGRHASVAGSALQGWTATPTTGWGRCSWKAIAPAAIADTNGSGCVRHRPAQHLHRQPCPDVARSAERAARWPSPRTVCATDRPAIRISACRWCWSRRPAPGVLWAYNPRHLQELQDYVAATLRERRGLFGRSMVARLPAWMKLARHAAADDADAAAPAAGRCAVAAGACGDVSGSGVRGAAAVVVRVLAVDAIGPARLAAPRGNDDVVLVGALDFHG